MSINNLPEKVRKVTLHTRYLELSNERTREYSQSIHHERDTATLSLVLEIYKN